MFFALKYPLMFYKKKPALLSRGSASSSSRRGVPVVVQFYPWVKFNSPLFLGMAMYDKDKRIKLNHNIPVAIRLIITVWPCDQFHMKTGRGGGGGGGGGVLC